jgi:RNA polymerase sigma-70 factor, ECF subfamily
MTRDDRPEGPRQQELAELFRTHANGLAGVVHGILGRHAESQELLQEAFLKAWQSLRRGFVPDNSVAWLFVITMNLAKDLRRTEMRRTPSQPLEETNPMELRSADPAPDARMTQSETLAAARAAIHELKNSEKEVFMLRTSAGLSFDEAAQALRIPVGTAKTRMRAALIHLRESLKQFAPAGIDYGIDRNTARSTNAGRQAR